MDWTNTGYSYHIDVHVVSPVNVDDTQGSLSGVVLNGTSITENYNSDSRIQGKVTTVVKEGTSDGYIENGRLRIIATILEHGWTEELMTGYVSDVAETTQNGYTKRVYTIEGSLWGLIDHKTNSPIVIGHGARLVYTWRQILGRLTRMQFDTTGALDYRFTTTTVYEVGTSLHTLLSELSSGYDRMNNNGHGRIVLSKYVAPSKQQTSRALDWRDSRGLILYPIERRSSKWEIPGRAVVTTTKSVTTNGKTVQKTLVGYYDAPGSNKYSLGARGWLKTIVNSYSGASSDPDSAELNAVAKRNWKAAQNEGNEWGYESVFANYHAGEVVNFVHPEANSNGMAIAKALITNVSTDLEHWTQSLTLLEV